MKIIPIWLGLLLTVGASDEVPVLKLKFQERMTIGIGAKQATILEFPRKVTGLLGYGLTDGKEEGTYHYAHPKDSRLLSLRNLAPGQEANIGVMLGRDLVLFHLVPDVKAPAAIRFTEPNRRNGPRARKISSAEVTDKRLDYGMQRLLQLLRLARNERVFEAYLPHLYADAESRRVELSYKDGDTSTIIRQLYRFPKEDALVLIGEAQNHFDYPIQVDPASFEVRVSERVYPVVLVDAAEMIPAKGAIPVHAIVKGDTEGNRAHLSIKNDFRLIMSSYCRYEEPDPEWGGTIDPSLFGNSKARPETVTVQNVEGGKK